MEEWPTGIVQTLSPCVRRLLAPNPSPFTDSGTQTYIVGKGEVAVIDPGPDLPAHLNALLGELHGERIVAIVCTHTHRDHSPASRPLAAATGAPIVGCAPLSPEDEEAGADDAFDADYSPDRVLGDGEQLEADGWTLEAIATPGHTSNHLCFAFPEERAVFTGDHVMGWSTSVISPPDGDMGAYMSSLSKLQGAGTPSIIRGMGQRSKLRRSCCGGSSFTDGSARRRSSPASSGGRAKSQHWWRRCIGESILAFISPPAALCSPTSSIWKRAASSESVETLGDWKPLRLKNKLVRPM
jgi:glyoxylase-like metal-dependent hydrolase (beta-lactamase superfamily II)